MMVQEGWSAVDGVLTGSPSYLSAFAESSQPEALTDGLGDRYEIMQAAIKKWCVGSPIQAALDALQALMAEHAIGPADVAALRAIMPDDRIHIVDNRDMPDVCLQHLLALLLIDGDVGFAAAHDHDRIHAPEILAMRALISAIPSNELTHATPARQAIIEIDTVDGRHLRHHTRAVLGTPANPMSQAQVQAKALDLMAPVLGDDGASQLADTLLCIEDLTDVRALRPLLAAAG